MFEDDRATALAADEFEDGMVRPDYGGYCFSGIPAAAADRLGVDLGTGLPEDAFGATHTDPAHAVVLFVDALGYRQFERVAGDVPFLRAFRECGRRALWGRVGVCARVTAAGDAPPRERGGNH
ncbi:hypothetical protein PNP85_14915 [Halobacterium salinarum]|uniref:hypothetical protein n=1 Tax=Halobacterium TaxID=2239 RepID=UPI001964D5CC|nr:MULTISPECIES: hypothetical protein [Halobacterium]MDL0135693.1 hypothetical protein [Halobacterium salinarum]MDL0140788.1 hypothetical protein [Halobacterium salinarum]MDL0144783.1 hypothetical protein [Halobacterium salinarum]QRY23642.1 hypothetical protein JT689_06350 [Halobacterium sp. GSL-19]